MEPKIKSRPLEEYIEERKRRINYEVHEETCHICREIILISSYLNGEGRTVGKIRRRCRCR